MQKAAWLGRKASSMLWASGVLLAMAGWVHAEVKAPPSPPASSKIAVPNVAYKENVHYKEVSFGQTVPGHEIEVLEFFSFACPHCASLEPTLQTWKKGLPKGVVFRRVPVVFRPQWENLAKAYYTLEALGLENLEPEVFKAIHQEKQDLSVSSTFISWLVKHHVDEKKAQSTYDSFTVTTRASQAKGMAQQYQIEGVPTIIVGGHYMTDVSKAGSMEALPNLINHLIQLAQKKRS
jgi:protein dithiol oxidoreductase (disulfide-forming)